MLAGKLKAKLAKKEPVFGGWISLAHPSIGEIFGGAGFDWVAVETEHTSIDNSQVLPMLMGIERVGATPLVRLAGIDPLQAKAVLDAGSAGVLVPMVNSRQDAEACVAMCKYPPLGQRGVGLARAQGYGREFSDYVSRANDETLVLAQIEHVQGVAKVEEILSVEGIDGVYIGPYDLSMSLGLPGQLDHPKVVEAMERVRKAALQAGKTAGIHLLHSRQVLGEAKRHLDLGYRFIALGSDLVILEEQSREYLAVVRALSTSN